MNESGPPTTSIREGAPYQILPKRVVLDFMINDKLHPSLQCLVY
jgi:hypothetical protein